MTARTATAGRKAASGSAPESEWDKSPSPAPYLFYHLRKGDDGPDVPSARDEQHTCRAAAAAAPDSEILGACREREPGPCYPDARFINGQFLAILVGEQRTPASAK